MTSGRIYHFVSSLALSADFAPYLLIHCVKCALLTERVVTLEECNFERSPIVIRLIGSLN
jgi:hypothetical protein